jgi:hypothetical protein
MPRWIGRLLWSVRGKRRVAVHLERHIAGVDSLTLEGVLVGRWAGHYVLEMGKLLTPNPDGSANTVSLDARYVEVPADRVLFVEVFSR